MFGRVASHGVSLLPVSDTEELFVRETVSHRSMPFLSLYTKSAHYWGERE